VMNKELSTELVSTDRKSDDSTVKRYRGSDNPKAQKPEGTMRVIKEHPGTNRAQDRVTARNLRLAMKRQEREAHEEEREPEKKGRGDMKGPKLATKPRRSRRRLRRVARANRK